MRTRAHRDIRTTHRVRTPDMQAKAAEPPKECSHFMLFGKWNFFSYPYDSPRAPLRHPDLLELIELLDSPSLGVRFNLKIPVLYRDPFSTVQSGKSRALRGDLLSAGC